MASKKNPILNLVGGLLGGVGSGNSAADKKIDLPDVVKITNKFGESMESFLDTEYEYIQYLRNRNCGGLGVGGLDGQRGAKSLIDYSRDKKRFRWGSGGIPLNRWDKRKTKVKKDNRGLRGWFQDKYSSWMERRAARKFNQGLAKKFNWDRRQIKAFRDARAKGHTWQQAQQIANSTARNRNIITRTIHGVQDWIPNRPSWMTRKEWGFLRPGVRERIGKFFKTKTANVKEGISRQWSKIKPQNFIPKKNPFSKIRIPGLSKLRGLGRMPWLSSLFAGLTFWDRKQDKDGDGEPDQTNLQAGIGTGAETACGVGFGALGTKWGAGIGGALGLKAFGIGAIPGAAIGGFIGGTLLGTIGAIGCGMGADWATGVGKTNKNKFGGLVNGAAQCTDCGSTSKHSGGAVINSPTRGILGGQKTLIGEAQEPELILPMSKIGDALSAVYREGASVMVGATISFLTPLSASPAVASVLGEARKLQSIVGTSDIEAETPKVPEIKQINVKASNNETNNMEKKFNSGGFVTGGTGIDKVPARLTAGEFVMSKGAVKRFGAGTLASMNAAGGGTNRPTPSGGYNQGGKSFDRSHYGTEGYQIGQINPPTLILSREEFKEESSDSNKKRNWLQKNITQRDYEKFTEYEGPILGKTRTKLETRDGNLVSTQTYESDIVSIGVPDLYAHKDQLLSAIHAVPGYGHVTIQDVINSKVGMPLKQYMMILMTSDAQAATFAKKDAAHQADLELRGIDPSKGYSMMYDFNGGGLVPPAISPSATSNIKPRSKKNFESVNQAPVVQAKKARVKSVILPVPQYIPQVVTRTVVQEVPVAKLGSLVISDQGKGVKIVS